ncbi:AMP-binding protein [Sulfitobacter sp. JB4-11]|uniref:AMP-binding protein n=1 Tax=Sulfitobacter rhodophyticola TaxID=3238304 RepID=UPI003D81553C
MQSTLRFQWHPDARMYAADCQISPQAATGEGFAMVKTHPPARALAELGQTLRAGRPFCLVDSAPPTRISAPPGWFMTQSGGSSGRPKLIRRRQSSWIASFEVNTKRFALRPADQVAVLGGLAHSLALYGVLEALHLGADAHVLSGLAPSRQANLMAKAKVTVLYATPTQIRMLAATRTSLPHLRLILCGGGALDAATRQIARTRFPNAALHVFYGTAETSFVSLAGEDAPHGSVGRAYPGVALEIRDPRGDPVSGPGEVWVRSPYLCDGYDGGGSDLVICQKGFVSTGEIGQVDGDGLLWLKGRRDRMITVGDVNAFPETVEDLIAAMPGVAHCAVLPRPDPRRGQHLVAVVAGQKETGLSLRIRDGCRASLGATLTPKHVLFHPAFPLLTSGKSDLVALAHWVEERS